MTPDAPPSTAALIRAALRDFRRAWLPLALYAAALRLLAGFVVVPAAARVLALVVAASGHSAVSNTDILTFLLTPAGLLAAALAGVAALSGALLEHTGVLAVAALTLSGRRVSVRQEAMAVVGGVVRVLRPGAGQLGLLAL